MIPAKHDNPQFEILAECNDGYLGLCHCCQEFNFAYKNTLLSFQSEEMHMFMNWLITKRDSEEHYLPLAHGRDRVFSSPHSNLFLTYSKIELEEIEHLYQEAMLILNARKLLLSKRTN